MTSNDIKYTKTGIYKYNIKGGSYRRIHFELILLELLLGVGPALQFSLLAIYRL